LSSRLHRCKAGSRIASSVREMPDTLRASPLIEQKGIDMHPITPLRRTNRRLQNVLAAMVFCALFQVMTSAQGLRGALIGTVKDAQGGVLPGASVQMSSPAIIGGALTMTTSEKGQLRFPA